MLYDYLIMKLQILLFFILFLKSMHYYSLVMVETLGVWGPEAISLVRELGRKTAALTGEPRPAAFLPQRIWALCTLQHFRLLYNWPIGACEIFMAWWTVIFDLIISAVSRNLSQHIYMIYKLFFLVLHDFCSCRLSQPSVFWSARPSYIIP